MNYCERIKRSQLMYILIIHRRIEDKDELGGGGEMMVNNAGLKDLKKLYNY